MDDACALILIDIQNDYFPGGRNPLVGAEAAARVARDVLEKSRQEQHTVIHVQHISLRPNATFFLPGNARHRVSPPGGAPAR
jgi:nicotinamidase-related amidase